MICRLQIAYGGAFFGGMDGIGRRCRTLAQTVTPSRTLLQIIRLGRIFLALPSHVVTVIDGDWLDTWDSGGETPLYYWEKG